MPSSAFFSFCSSLPLPELRAISELSRVRHFAENDLVYSSGDACDELFIINRGLLEITPEPAHPGMMATVLSRGDIFGETGAFLHLPRNQMARARAELSVQCFRGQDFPKLLQRVPSLFLFLCEKLAHQLFQLGEIGRSQGTGGELVGSLANFDMITIYQTIVRSMQTGLLSIAGEKGEAVCAFYFDEGVPRRGRFQHLSGEEAFWQLFIQTRPGWTFSFAQKTLVGDDWTKESAINRDSDELLFNAIRMRDEFEDLRKRMGDGTANVKRRQLNFEWPSTELDELRLVAEEIWQVAYSQPIALANLCRLYSVCDLKIYRAVDEMTRAGLFVLQNNGGITMTPETQPKESPQELILG
ncbi:MAG: cyclic nucleotide-binding domain-containing protein [Verrucomicrobiota bacterium]